MLDILLIVVFLTNLMYYLFSQIRNSKEIEMGFFRSRAERVGVDKMEVGDVINIQPNEVTDSEKKSSYYTMQTAIHGHGSYYGKKFQCKTVDGVLYVKRKS